MVKSSVGHICDLPTAGSSTGEKAKPVSTKGLSAEELQDKMWSEYSKEFAHAVLQDMNDFSGDELFEIGE